MVPLRSHRAKSGQLETEAVWRICDAWRELICWEGAAAVQAAPEMNVAVIVGGMFWEPVQSNYALKEPERRALLSAESIVCEDDGI